MALTRTLNWDSQEFHQFLMARRNVPFKYGVNDCCLFAADAIESFTKVDIAEDFRGKYTDAASAQAAIKTITGGSTVADAAAWCANRHGLVERSVLMMVQRGDLVVIPNGDGSLIAGVVHLSGRHVISVGEKGIVRFPLRNITHAWKV